MFFTTLKINRYTEVFFLWINICNSIIFNKLLCLVFCRQCPVFYPVSGFLSGTLFSVWLGFFCSFLFWSIGFLVFCPVSNFFPVSGFLHGGQFYFLYPVFVLFYAVCPEKGCPVFQSSYPVFSCGNRKKCDFLKYPNNKNLSKKEFYQTVTAQKIFFSLVYNF